MVIFGYHISTRIYNFFPFDMDMGELNKTLKYFFVILSLLLINIVLLIYLQFFIFHSKIRFREIKVAN